MSSTQTIVAIGSPPGQAGRGLVRLSGPEVGDVLKKLGVDVAQIKPRVLTQVCLQLGGGGVDCKGGEATAEHTLTLPAMLWWAKAANPNTTTSQAVTSELRDASGSAQVADGRKGGTYTGQDTAECICVGHPVLLEKVVQACCAAGARLAEPGEFTFLAYTSGRLDLTQAEGVAATIAAVSDAQLAAADQLKRGRLGSFSESLVDRLSTLLALVEAGIDFVDQEDVNPIAPDALHDGLTDLIQKLNDLIGRSRSWSALDGLPRVVLVGAPSAGKSTLFNALLGHERSVVDATPGTTRDVIQEPLVIDSPTGPAEVMLVDVAGLDEVLTQVHDQAGQAQKALARIERQTQKLALEQIRSADLVVEVVEAGDWEGEMGGSGGCVAGDGGGGGGGGGRTAQRVDASVFEKTVGSRLLVWTKVDRFDARSDEPCDSAALNGFKQGEQGGQDERDEQAGKPVGEIKVSAQTGLGIDVLKQAIAERLKDRAVSLQAAQLALQPRHEQALGTAQRDLTEAQDALAWSLGLDGIEDVELVAGAMRGALNELAGLGGKMTPDDVIGKVFATFCVGK